MHSFRHFLHAGRAPQAHLARIAALSAGNPLAPKPRCGIRTKYVQTPYSERNEILENLTKGRNAAVRVLTVSKINGHEYMAASAVLEAIDDLLDALRAQTEGGNSAGG